MFDPGKGVRAELEMHVIHNRAIFLLSVRKDEKATMRGYYLLVVGFMICVEIRRWMTIDYRARL